MPFILEICVDSIESACAVRETGASRIELCSALSEGGLTPSTGLISSVRSNLDIEINVLIRPRRGDFLYSDNEFSVMRWDIELAGEAGANGIVTGILLHDGSIDVERTALLAEYAAPMSVTFHRAFDLCRDPRKALNDIILTGALRVLTSGQAQKAVEGAALIKDLIGIAGNKLIIMPGGGINEYNIAALAASTGAHEFHMSARKAIQSRMTYRKKGVSMGGNQIQSEYELNIPDIDRIRSVINILEHIEI